MKKSTKKDKMTAPQDAENAVEISSVTENAPEAEGGDCSELHNDANVISVTPIVNEGDGEGHEGFENPEDMPLEEIDLGSGDIDDYIDEDDDEEEEDNEASLQMQIYAIVSLASGLLSCLLCGNLLFCLLGLIFSVVGLIFGIIVKKNKVKTSIATFGIICSIAGFILSVLLNLIIAITVIITIAIVIGSLILDILLFGLMLIFSLIVSIITSLVSGGYVAAILLLAI